MWWQYWIPLWFEGAGLTIMLFCDEIIHNCVVWHSAHSGLCLFLWTVGIYQLYPMNDKRGMELVECVCNDYIWSSTAVWLLILRSWLVWVGLFSFCTLFSSILLLSDYPVCNGRNGPFWRCSSHSVSWYWRNYT